jgi:hypothetical protein
MSEALEVDLLECFLLLPSGLVAILPILEFELGQNLLLKKVFLLHTELDIWSMSHWSIYL